MKDQGMFWLLLLLVNSARAGATTSYFVNGGTLNLRPKVTPPLTSILWKHSGDLLAEWTKSDADFTYYGDYNGRTTLDSKTGHLEIRNMNETKDSGSYTLEINNVVHGESYTAIRITEVPKPSVWIIPVACDHFKTNCSLSCDGETAEAGPVTYTWMKDDKVWDGAVKKEVPILKADTEDVKTFSCRMKNPVSEKESEPKDNPFFAESSSSSPVGPVLGVLIPVLVLVGVGVWQRKRIKGFFSPSDSGNAANSAPASKPENSTPTTEVVPLNKNGEDAKTVTIDPE